jgi:tetratricopeptide (TPR) repeat protein
MRRALPALVFAFATTLASGTLASNSALELVRIAQAHERAHEEDVALRRYMEALSLDPTCEEAYLGLGSLRARRGDLREAERVYTVALERLPQLRDARLARAHVRRSLGLRHEAVDDLLGGTDGDIRALRILATWYGEDGQTPAQLSVWRRIAARAETTQDAPLQKEAQTMIRALVILLGPADPAAAPADERGLRRTFATIARRGGV